ncbi:PD-(D/E)XK nuclease family protein [Gordonia sp. NPDC003504]
MSDPNHLLGRVLRSEVDVSSLLGYLISLDASPITAFLNLDRKIVNVRVEVPYTRSSRMDVVLDGNDGPIAVLELKVSADEHGDQLDRYQQFAHEHGARCYIVDLEGSNSVQRERWEHIDLVDAFACFASSPNVTAREFGSAIAAVLQQWQTQMAGPFARMDSAVVPVVLRQVRKRLQDEGYETYAGTTAAGQPMLTAFQPHPSGQDRAFLCVDLRCQDKRVSTTKWLFRVGVQVDRGEDLADDRKRAHDLATQLAPALTLADLRASLARAVGTEIAAAVRGTKPLKSPQNSGASIQKWLEAVDAAGDGPGPRRHPSFHNDWGRRLAAQFTFDLSRVTPDSLFEVVTATLNYLNDATDPGRSADLSVPEVQSVQR